MKKMNIQKLSEVDGKVILFRKRFARTKAHQAILKVKKMKKRTDDVELEILWKGESFDKWMPGNELRKTLTFNDEVLSDEQIFMLTDEELMAYLM